MVTRMAHAKKRSRRYLRERRGRSSQRGRPSVRRKTRHRADPGAERLLEEEAREEDQDEDHEPGGVNGVDLAGGEEMAQAQQGGDGEEAFDPRGSLAHHASRLEAVHPARELPADDEDGEKEAGLGRVARPLDPPTPGTERGSLHHLRGGSGGEADEGPGLVEGHAGEPGEGVGDHGCRSLCTTCSPRAG
jgi:hypothetical protein